MKSVNFIPTRFVQTNTASLGADLRCGTAPKVSIHDSYTDSSEKGQRKTDPTPAAWRMMPPLVQESILGRLTAVEQAKLCIADRDIWVLSAGIDLAMHDEQKYAALVARANDLLKRTFDLASLAQSYPQSSPHPSILMQRLGKLAGAMRRLHPVLSEPPGDAKRRRLAKRAADKLISRSESAIRIAFRNISLDAEFFAQLRLEWQVQQPGLDRGAVRRYSSG